ncbi:MAG: hypothetical protein WCW13_05470 [archaeon]
MEKEKIVQFLGIFVFAFMALSMLAAGVLYNEKDTSSTTNTDTLPQAQENAFNYTLTFNAITTKELASLRLGAMTSESNKTLIDASVMKVEGISKVTSIFRKTAFDSNSWLYLAEVSLKKNYNAAQVSDSIKAISYFDQSQDPQAMKYMVIAVPSSAFIHNVDLNIDKNFSFPATTLSTLANSATQVGDEISVQGTAKIQGKAIMSIELIEIKNISQEKRIEEILKNIADQNASVGSPNQTDLNLPKSDTNSPAPDTNSPVKNN